MAVHTDGQTPVGAGLLKAVPWFAACTDDQLADVARLAERLRIEAGEVILREGRLGRELFIVLEGTATVTRVGRVVNVIENGGYFGELAAIEAIPRTATVTATSDLDVLVIGPRQFEAMTDIPGFRKALLASMSRRIRQADDRLAAYGDHVDDYEVDGHGETNARLADAPRDGETATD
jgi:CRP/FNR family transcriptional regulator, cyclic AMP receptor protein